MMLAHRISCWFLLITLAILAAVWWLLILRVLYSIVQIVVRLIRVIFTSQEQETYG